MSLIAERKSEEKEKKAKQEEQNDLQTYIRIIDEATLQHALKNAFEQHQVVLTLITSQSCYHCLQLQENANGLPALRHAKLHQKTPLYIHHYPLGTDADRFILDLMDEKKNGGHARLPEIEFVPFMMVCSFHRLPSGLVNTEAHILSNVAPTCADILAAIEKLM